MHKIILYIIRILSRYAYKAVTVSDKDEQVKVERVMDEEGRPLILHYYGKDRPMWKYKNENDIRIARSIWLKFFDSEKEQNITTDMLVKYCKDTIESINNNNLAKAGSNQFALLDIIQNLTPMDVLRNQFAVLLFDEEENLKAFDADRHAAKVQAMRNYPDQGFFFSMLLKVGGISGGESPKDILKYLRASEVKLRAYTRMLSDPQESNHTKSGKEQ